MKFDGAAFGQEVIDAVKMFVDGATKPLIKRIDELETQLKQATAPVDYDALLHDSIVKAVVDAMGPVELRMHATLPSVDDIKGLVADAVAGVEVIHGKDGSSITLEDVAPMIEGQVKAFTENSTKALDDIIRNITTQLDTGMEAIAGAIAAIPVPVDGKSVTIAEVLAEVGPAVDEIVHRLDEQSMSVDRLVSEKLEAIDVAIAAIPVPINGKDGTSVTLDEVMPIVNQAITTMGESAQKAIDDLNAAIAAIPAPVNGVDGKDGASVTLDDLAPWLFDTRENLAAEFKALSDGLIVTVSDAVAAIPEPVNGKDGASVTLEDVMPTVQGFIAEQKQTIDDLVTSVLTTVDQSTEDVKAAIASIPAPVNGKDGASVTLDDVMPAVNAFFDEHKAVLGTLTESLVNTMAAATDAMDEAVKAIPDEVKKWMPSAINGKDGTSVDIEEVKVVIFEEVSKQFDERAGDLRGEQGPPVDPDMVKAFVGELVDAAVKTIPVPVDGKDGVNLAGALINREGELVVTLSNGKMVELGPVVGTKGDPGRDGMDGVSFDDMDIIFDEEGRSFTIVAEKGENKKRWDFKLSHVLDRGVWREGTYLKGDGTTYNGSFWIAQKDTDTKPGNSDDWRLAVKKGRDGRDRPQPPQKPVTNLPLGG